MRAMPPFALVTALLVPTAATAQAPELAFPIEVHELSNGLRVILQPDPSTPTVALSVYYDVGSRNEVPGRSGFAHLFEHMMFQGSANVGKGEHFQLIGANGGRMNGTTSEDRTNYFEVLPADRLALGLWLESDRMRSLDISEANFENQREVVKEERRLRVDNVPYIPAWLAFQEFAYESWEYAHSVIGSMEDLDAAELEDVRAFFDLWYAPNNAILTIVGDFEPSETLGLVEAYFGDIPRGAAPPGVDIVEPSQTEYRELVVDDALATQPALIAGWHVPPASHPDSLALDLLGRVLTGGQSSRLYDRLIRRDQLALEVQTWVEGRRGPDQFTAWAITRGADPEAVRDVLFEEIDRLITEGITDEELRTAKEQVWRDLVSRVETTLGRAIVIGNDALFFGDPARVNTLAAAYDAVTVDDVARVARTWLRRDNCDAVLIRVATPTETTEDAQEVTR